jgi:hypothetical protein
VLAKTTRTLDVSSMCTYNFSKSSQRRKQGWRRLSLPINLIQHQDKISLFLCRSRGQTFLQENNQSTNVLASTLAELFPLVFLVKCLQCIPKDLRQ